MTDLPQATEPFDAHPRPARPIWKQLWLWVLAAMIIGVVLGIAAPQTAVAMQPLGQAFIKLISMVIAPLIFCTIVSGIANMADMARVGRIAGKALVIFYLMTLLAITVALVSANLLQPGVGMNINPAALKSGAELGDYLQKAEQVTPAGFLLNIIPKTFVGAFVEGNVLQVLFLAVLSGFALIWLGKRAQPLLDVLDTGLQMIFRIVAMIMWVAPIGAFGAIAFTVGKFGVGSLASLGTLIGEFYLVCIIFILLAAAPIAWWCGFNLLKFVRYFRDELLISIATTSSETVLPRIMTKLNALGCEKGLVGFVVPAGYSFNLTGACLYLGMTTIFLAQATNTHLTFVHQLGLLLLMTVTSKGAAGIPGAAFVVLAATIEMDHSIPLSSVAMMLGIHRLMSQGFTPTFVITNTIAAMGIARWDKALDTEKMRAELG
ncbi:cation:dicarboxylase symporter family transporter [Sphingomonas sp. 3P27F8]|uniref:cation:dicarboxylate symporter family transporter n=1 Tax=Sphingomonas sp. 3P27F8 TaxID=2502213 RepID=UPI0010F90F0B|nr:cation:dicarboxylase symporter family transporter [Sphingomonas sp. 3P27F8]